MIVFEVSHFISIIAIGLTALIALWNIHIKSNDQAGKLKEMEIRIKNNEDKIKESKIRIDKLEERDDLVVEVRTELKHVSKRLDEITKKLGGDK